MRSRAWLLVAALIFASPLLGAPAPAAEPVPDAATIRAQVRAAAGALPSAYRETDEIVYSNGTTTVEHDYVRGKDYRYVYDSGPVHTEEGLLGRDAWSMNANGQVIVDDPDDRSDLAEPDAPKDVVTRVKTPVDGYLIAAIDKRGRGRKEYVDPTTWRVVRRETIAGEGKIVRTYDDIRADHGRTFAHRVHVDDGPAKLRAELTVTAYDDGPVSDADLAIPRPRQRLVDVPSRTSPIELPARFVRGQIFVRVMVGTRGLDFTLDTGASGITIDENVAAQLGLKRYGRHSERAAGRFETASSVIPEMTVGSLRIHDVAVDIIPHGWEADAGRIKDVGLLGFDFLAELGVTIDYENQRVTVVPGDAFAPPADPRTVPLDVHIGDGAPRVTIAVNGAVGKHFILDTGADGSFLITAAFNRRHPEALKGQTLMGDPRSFFGIGGAFSVRPYKMHSLRLAKLNLLDWVGYQITSDAYDEEPLDGLIGTEFLQLFTVHLDYGNSRVYLVPNKEGRERMGLKA